MRWCGDRYNCSLHFDTSLVDFDLDSRSQKCKKSKNFCSNYVTKFSITLSGIWYIVEICWCLNVVLISSHSFTIQGREPYLCDLIKKICSIGVYSDIYGPMSFKLVMI